MLDRTIATWVSVIVVIILASVSIFHAFAITPEGATVTFVSNSTKEQTASPGGRNDTKGRIITVTLDTQQQDTKWKAYVGNVSASFTLDDAQGYTIYQWPATSSYQFSGQVYVTRDSAVTWSSIACASAANKATEDTRLGHDSGEVDSINRTFTTQTHQEFDVAGTPFAEDDCYALATWVNDTTNTLSAAAKFQEVLLWEGTSIVYATFIENDWDGYHNGTTYDFQIIVPDNATASSPNSLYYFYIELQ